MKRQTLKLNLKKTKIVNLSTTSQLYGGTDGPMETDMNDPEASCGVRTTYDTVTNDKANTNNGIPTIGGGPIIIIGVTYSCVVC